jgi:transcriptional antiterminator RfaH
MQNYLNNWYVLYTRPNHEKKVASYLLENQIEHYLPIIKTIRKWHDRNKFVSMPLFPSYVFVFLKDLANYHCTLSNAGAVYFLKAGDRISSISKSIIDSIRLVIDNGHDVEVTNVFQLGQPVMIQKGPFSGLSGEMIKHEGKKMMQVRVNVLERSLLVSMPPENLAAV